MMQNWLTWKSRHWTRSCSHVSVTAAVIVFALLSLLLSSTTVSLSGSAFVSFTSNVTASFFTNMNNIDNMNNPPAAAAPAVPAAPAAAAAPEHAASDDHKAAPEVGIHGGDNSSSATTKLNNDSGSSYVDPVKRPTPASLVHDPAGSIVSAAALPPAAAAAAPQQNTVLEDQSRDEGLYGNTTVAAAAPNLAWSPAAAAPSVLDERQSQPDTTHNIQGGSRTLTSPSPSPAAVFQEDLELDSKKQQPAPPVEKFLMPLLSYQVGAGNQLMEYMSAAIMARALNRTLCLADFFAGPSRHTERSVRGGGGLAMEDRYDKESLSRFVRVTSKDNCLQQCAKTLDARWLLKPMREPKLRDWVPMRTNESLYLSREHVRWQTPADIAQGLGSFNEHCVAVGGLFPGLRWRGGFLAVSAFLRPSKRIASLADGLQAMAIGKNVPYLAIHWRFEVSECGSRNSGLCFVRCGDGALIDSGLHPSAKEWSDMSAAQCKNKARGVLLDKADLFDAIFDRAQNYSLHTVYLATDGWIRSQGGSALVKEAVEELRKRGLAVVGLWNIKNLPNFSNGSTFNPKSTLGTRPVTGHQIAVVEQEICTRSSVFLGSSQSTWSLAVFRLRLARRRAKQILESRLNVTRASGMILQQQGDNSAGVVAIKKQMQEEEEDEEAQVSSDHEAVIEELMKDNHAAGLQCRYTRYFNRFRVNATVETYADELPDGWLDLEACEARIGHDGKCTVAKCI